MKIILISQKDPLSIKNWSGTVKSIYDCLEQNNIVIPVKLHKNIKIYFYDFIYMLLRKLKFRRLAFFEKRSYLMSQAIGRQIEKIKNVDFIIAPSGSQIISNISTSVPIIYYSDATFKVLENYYIHDLKEKDKTEGNIIDLKAISSSKLCLFASDWAAQSAIDDYEADPSKVKVLKFPAYLPDLYKEKTPFKLDKVKLLFVGVDWERKGADLAIKTAAKLEKLYPGKFSLDIIGLDKPDKEVISENIKFHGFLNKNSNEDRNKIIEFYQNSHLFFLPTKAEAAGIVFSEASEYGLPIITHNTGGISSYVGNDISGKLLPIGSSEDDFINAILSIVGCPNTYIRYSKNARNKYLNELNWQIWEKQLKYYIEKIS